MNFRRSLYLIIIGFLGIMGTGDVKRTILYSYLMVPVSGFFSNEGI